MKKLTLLLLLMISTNIQADNTPDWEKKWCKPCSSLEDNVTTLCKNDKSKKVCLNGNIWVDYETFHNDITITYLDKSNTSPYTKVSSEHYSDDYPTNVGLKLTSGITNILFGVVEIPKTIIIYNKCYGLLKASTSGFIQGIVWMGIRTVKGFVDTLFFFMGGGQRFSPIYIWNDFDIKTHGNGDPVSSYSCDKK